MPIGVNNTINNEKMRKIEKKNLLGCPHKTNIKPKTTPNKPWTKKDKKRNKMDRARVRGMVE